VQWLASGDYRKLRSLYFDSGSTADAFGYRGQLSLLADSPLPLTFTTSRGRSEFTGSAGSAIGSSLATTWSGTALLRADEYPALRLALTRTDVDNRSLGAPEATSGSTLLAVSAAQSTPGYQYDVSYDTSWNRGTHAETNYRSHAVGLQASTPLSDAALFRAYERYTLRDPSRDDPVNPRYDDNATGAGLQYRPGEATTASFDYAYHRLNVAVKDAPDAEQLAHTLSQVTTHRLTRDLSLSGTTALSWTRQRLGATEVDTGAQSAGAGATWRHDLPWRATFDAGAGGSLGAAEPTGSPAALTYGGSGNAGLTVTRERVRASATASASLQEDATSRTVEERGLVQVEGAVRRVYLNAIGSVGTSRREDRLLGAFESRSATASFTASYRRHSAQLMAGVTDGLAQPLAPAAAAPGTPPPVPALVPSILPVAFNTLTRYATLSSSWTGDGGRLVLTALARTMATTAPARPLQYEHGAGATVAYTLGAVTISAEERYSIGGAGDARQRGNTFMLRAVRSFGAVF
jgi:hypothetical protein